MNRKFINAFFAAALLLGGATVFSSCKDTNEDMRTELDAKIADLENRLNGLDLPANLTETIQNLLKLKGLSQGVLDAIESQITELENYANVAVTSVVLQSVENPVFGSISLPIDVKSNMLLTYYGAFDEMDFPSTKSANNIGAVLSANEVAMTEKVGGEEVTAYADGVEKNYLGTVYTTINPSSVDAASDKINWSLVNSQDVNYGGIALKDIKLSDKVLEFGLGSRANNGFYEAAAVAENLDEIKYEIVDGLAEEVKDALTNHTKQDAKDLIQLVIAQLRKNDFPALGVKADYSWKEIKFEYELNPSAVTETQPQEWIIKPNTQVETIDHNSSVYSEYAIAAAAFKPLSFDFLKGESLDKLPVLPDLGDYTLTPEDLGITGVKKITVTFEDITLETEDGVKIKAGSLDELAAEINRQMGAQADDINAQIAAAFKKVNDKIAAATDKVQPWIDRANRVINKVNSLLENPNHYLQVCALYENGDKIGRLSNTSVAPSYFPGIEDGAALNLILTTYNLETVCPAYMKYYAVYKVGETTPVVAKIIPGTTSRVAVKGLSAGSYKVVYQALDYHGVTSTQKFYVEIGNN